MLARPAQFASSPGRHDPALHRRPRHSHCEHRSTLPLQLKHSGSEHAAQEPSLPSPKDASQAVHLRSWSQDRQCRPPPQALQTLPRLLPPTSRNPRSHSLQMRPAPGGARASAASTVVCMQQSFLHAGMRAPCRCRAVSAAAGGMSPSPPVPDASQRWQPWLYCSALHCGERRGHSGAR